MLGCCEPPLLCPKSITVRKPISTASNRHSGIGKVLLPSQAHDMPNHVRLEELSGHWDHDYDDYSVYRPSFHGTPDRPAHDLYCRDWTAQERGDTALAPADIAVGPKYAAHTLVITSPPPIPLQTNPRPCRTGSYPWASPTRTMQRNTQLMQNQQATPEAHSQPYNTLASSSLLSLGLVENKGKSIRTLVTSPLLPKSFQSSPLYCRESDVMLRLQILKVHGHEIQMQIDVLVNSTRSCSSLYLHVTSLLLAFFWYSSTPLQFR